MRLPDLLATRRGRLACFFLLYTTEGVPLGFAATAVATQLRRMGVGPAEIGAFVAAFYLPWAFKWAAGPLVDVFRSRRWGHRRAWILATQLAMAATLLSLLWVPLPQGLPLFTAVLLLHNACAATQDVAIDALAIQTLQPDERGLASGLMFAGAVLGQAAGGAGVLFLASHLGFEAGFVAVALAILAVTGGVVLPMKEPAASEAPAAAGWREALGRMRDFAGDAFRAFLGSRAAFCALFFALLPAGAMSLSLALQSSLAVELGMSDEQVALLALLSTLTSGVCMVLGGLLSDRLGRRRMLALYLVTMSLPVLWLAWVLQQAGYTMPRAPGSAPLPELIEPFRVAVIAFNAAMGLMYGTRSAVFMDLTDPRVAATQFTAYMAMMNVAIAFSATWQGVAVEALGYPATLLLDACVGPLCVLLLPWMAPGIAGAGGTRRARGLALALATGCLAFGPWWLLHDPRGAAAGLAQTLFTLVFVASALFLLAGSLLQPLSPAWRTAARALALALLLLYARRFVGAEAPLLLRAGVAAVAGVGALALLRLALAPWPGLTAPPAPAPAPAAAPAPGPAAGRGSPAG